MYNWGVLIFIFLIATNLSLASPEPQMEVSEGKIILKTYLPDVKSGHIWIQGPVAEKLYKAMSAVPIVSSPNPWCNPANSRTATNGIQCSEARCEGDHEVRYQCILDAEDLSKGKFVLDPK